MGPSLERDPAAKGPGLDQLEDLHRRRPVGGHPERVGSDVACGPGRHDVSVGRETGERETAGLVGAPDVELQQPRDGHRARDLHVGAGSSSPRAGSHLDRDVPRRPRRRFHDVSRTRDPRVVAAAAGDRERQGQHLDGTPRIDDRLLGLPSRSECSIAHPESKAAFDTLRDPVLRTRGFSRRNSCAPRAGPIAQWSRAAGS